MKFENITITDFRSYYGENKVEFANKSKSVTMLVGNNGGGKSSLMAAIQWCLYGEQITSNRIIHDEAQSNSCSVDIVFTHNEKTYRVLRKFERNASQTSLRINEVEKDGREGVALAKSQMMIDGFLPFALKNWFFYDAEGSEKVNTVHTFDLEGSKASKEALRQIQGFTKIDQLIEDLNKIEADKRRDLIMQGENIEAQAIQKKIDVLKPKQDSLLKVKLSAEDDLEGLMNREKELNEQYRDIPKTEPLKKELDSLKKDLQILSKDLSQKDKKQRSFLADHLPVFLIKQLITKNKGPRNEDEDVKIVQEPEDRKLFEKIMEAERCICKAKVLKGSTEEQNIKDALLGTTEDPDKKLFNDRVSTIQNVIAQVEINASRFIKERNEIQEEIESYQSQIEEKEKRQIELEDEIADIGNSDKKVKLILDQINVITPKIKALSLTVSGATLSYQNISKDIQELKNKLNSADNQNKQNKALSDLIKKISTIKEYAIDKQKQDEKIALRLLMLDLNAAIGGTSFANIQCKINPNTYAVTVMDKNTNTTKSVLNGGQIELIKTCLIACIVGQASKKTQTKYKYLARPTSAPLIIDAPFTKMDKEYIKGCVSVLLEKTEQLILLSLPADFEKYEEDISSMIGKQYVLIHADSGPQDKKTISRRRIFGQDIDLNVYDNTDDNDGEAITQTKIKVIQ